jgi:hypothetical protein
MASPTKIESVSDLCSASWATLSRFPGQPWWRGHAVASWRLVPSVLREDLGPIYEANIANKFAARAPSRYPKTPGHGELANWLFLMQHYGLPTRLLDWTESPLMAAYFAVSESEEKHAKEDGALWALDAFTMNGITGGQEGLLQPGHAYAKNLVELAFTQGTAVDRGVAAIVTEEIDLRMLVQMSGFTIHGDPTPLDARSELDELLARFVIPAAAKDRIRRELASLGIRERTVYPDLDHLASDLARDAYANFG